VGRGGNADRSPSHPDRNNRTVNKELVVMELRTLKKEVRRNIERPIGETNQ
jgi:hypothetical protein